MFDKWKYFNYTNDRCNICHQEITVGEPDIICVKSKGYKHYRFYHKKCIYKEVNKNERN